MAIRYIHDILMMTVSYVFCNSYNIAGLSDSLSQDVENEKIPLDPKKTGWLSLYISLEPVSLYIF